MRVWFNGRTSAFQAEDAGSIPATRSIIRTTLNGFWLEKVTAHIAQSVEHFLGKEEVIGSNPIVSTICCAEGRGVKVNGACRDDKHRISEQKASE